MAQALKTTCLECGQVNRIPQERLANVPKCGTCGARLADGSVRELDPPTLKKAIANDELPLIVDFWAPWCGPCRMMAPEFARAAGEMAGRVRFAKINTEDFPAVARERGIRGIPLLILFRNGREVARLTGARPAAEIARFARSGAETSRAN